MVAGLSSQSPALQDFTLYLVCNCPWTANLLCSFSHMTILLHAFSKMEISDAYRITDSTIHTLIHYHLNSGLISKQIDNKDEIERAQDLYIHSHT